MAFLHRSACVLGLGLAGGCGSGALQPQLVLEALVITRARETAERRDLSQDYTVTAALSMPVDTAGAEAVHAGLQIEAAVPVPGGVRMNESEPAVGCDVLLQALCAWAQRAEDAAWTVLLTEWWGAP